MILKESICGKLTTFIIICLYLSSCTLTPGEIQHIYDDRTKIITSFENTSFYTRGKSRYYTFITYDKNHNANFYHFILMNGYFELLRDSLTYSPNLVDTTAGASVAFKKDLSEKSFVLRQLMESYGINGFESLYSEMNMTMIYMKSGRQMLYIPLVNEITNEFKAIQLTSFRTIGEHWYYRF